MTRPRALVQIRALAATNSFSNTASDGVRLDEGADRQRAVRLDAGFAAASRIYLEGGVQADRSSEHRLRLRSSSGRYVVINDFTAHAVRSGGYLQARFSAGSLTVVPGLRADHWSLTGDSTTSPWVQAQMQLPAMITVRAGAGRHQQFPAFEHVVGALASSSVLPLCAEHFDVGIEQRLGKSVRWQITAYNRDEDGYFRRRQADTRLMGNAVIRGIPRSAIRAVASRFCTRRRVPAAEKKCDRPVGMGVVQRTGETGPTMPSPGSPFTGTMISGTHSICTGSSASPTR